MFQKIFSNLLLVNLLLLASYAGAALKNAGKLHINSDIGASIYIDGHKKSVIGDKGYANILLTDGEHTIKVERVTDEWIYQKTRTVFSGSNISISSFDVKYPFN